MHSRIFKLALLLGSAAYSLAAVYTDVSQLPSQQYDFIVVGGSYQLRSLHTMTKAGSPLFLRGHLRRCDCEPFVRESVCLRALTGSWRHVRPLLPLNLCATLSTMLNPSVFSNQNVLDSEVPLLAFGLAGTINDWNYTTVPQAGLNNRTVAYTRGRMLGGSSSVSAY